MFSTAYNTETQALEVLRDTSAGELKREDAIRFLGRHPSQLSIRALIDSMEDDDFGVHWEAAVTLAQYGELPIPALLETLMDPQRVSCPRLREGASQVLENNASSTIVALSAELRAALKGPAADVAAMTAAYRLQERLKRMHWTPKLAAPDGKAQKHPQKSGVVGNPGDQRSLNWVSFYARDLYHPEATESELEWFIQRFHDVWDWRMQPDGQVLVQYDPSKISDQIIEDVLAHNGFEVKHIADFSSGYIQ